MGGDREGMQSRLPHGRAVPHPGLLWQLRPSDVEVELLAHTRDVVSRELPAETGLHTGWVQNGGLFIASNKQRLDEYKRLMSVGNGPPGVTPRTWWPPGFHKADKIRQNAGQAGRMESSWQFLPFQIEVALFSGLHRQLE